MLALVVFAFQNAASPMLMVRGADGMTPVPLAVTAHGKAVRPDLLSPAVPSQVRAGANGHHTIAIGGIEVEVALGIPFAKIGSSVVPLTSAPYLDRGKLHVPLHLVSELLPRYATNLVFDTSRMELRVFTPPPDRGTTVFSKRPSSPVGGTISAAGRKKTSRLKRNRIVVVDAGHGGPDNGMTGRMVRGRRLYEKDVTLAVARRVAEMLRAEGVTVVMTRTTDTLIALSDRGRIANERRGDVFISIHVNAANPTWRNPQGARGFETYFLAEAKTEDAKRVEQMENEAVRFETSAGPGKNDDLSFIINDMAQNEHLRESSDLAETVQRALARVHPGPSRGVKQAGFRVLVSAFMPAVLIEVGFGTNPDEAAFLSDPASHRALARAVTDATIEYLEHYESRVGGGK